MTAPTPTAVHALLDDAASAINQVHARALAAVIEAHARNLPRDVDGHSGLREWLRTTFDFHAQTAADLGAIARNARKFTALTEAATTGTARIDRIAAAVRRLEQVQALRVYAKTYYREPVPSPFDPSRSCPTPEHLIREWCVHGTVEEVRTHIGELLAALDTGEEILEGLGQESLQRLDLAELPNGMWAVDATLAADTGRLFAKYLATAVPPPRQDESDADGVLPAQANRNAEALHQLLAGYGASPHAATRHGHTATLDLTVDIETLRGEDTGRLPLLEGKPISVGKARLLACEAGVVPSVFDYAAGEAVELGRALRLPNTALRRKLELEQPAGCAWQGCERPIYWTEAHHIEHWADGGATVAENLILLCRFHHGRIHTKGWSLTKTGPGRASIVHHDHADGEGVQSSEGECGCADWRTDADMDTLHADADAFPTGLYRSEWTERTRHVLAPAAEAVDMARTIAAMNAAKARARAKFAIPTRASEAEPMPIAEANTTRTPHVPDTPRCSKVGSVTAAEDPGEPPFLTRPSRRRPRRGRSATDCGMASSNSRGFEPVPMLGDRNRYL
ncbi:HNH endonuclease signature motif containing protein [Glycomyces paridis]|uniref:DUF222 domain-containing protein n=1 Tax=Glycomyces paridis TaxID=2126555 RepID=A0A4S8PMJ8_9ACTN|nr:HNH endonuclease signature motif containing protein [Glycomyces paridis]THV31997.1 DUF222 domain-containing protein [Glycomyces paridis]